MSICQSCLHLRVCIYVSAFTCQHLRVCICVFAFCLAAFICTLDLLAAYLKRYTPFDKKPSNPQFEIMATILIHRHPGSNWTTRVDITHIAGVHQDWNAVHAGPDEHFLLNGLNAMGGAARPSTRSSPQARHSASVLTSSGWSRGLRHSPGTTRNSG